MQFAVPQFIESEAKIFFFLTVRQFIMMIAVFGAIFALVYSNVNIFVMIFGGIGLFGAGVTLAFVKVNGESFEKYLSNILGMVGRPAVRVWRKEKVTSEMIVKIYKKEADKAKESGTERKIVRKRQVNRGSLAQLALMIDTGGAYKQ